MEYMIEKTSRYGRDQLLDRPFGTVHSAYEHAVNIEVGGRLFCLQPAGSSMSPISLITNLSEAAFDDLKVLFFIKEFPFPSEEAKNVSGSLNLKEKSADMKKTGGLRAIWKPG